MQRDRYRSFEKQRSFPGPFSFFCELAGKTQILPALHAFFGGKECNYTAEVRKRATSYVLNSVSNCNASSACPTGTNTWSWKCAAMILAGMPLAASLFETAAVSPTASRLECTDKVMPLKTESYWIPATSACSLERRRLRPSSSR